MTTAPGSASTSPASCARSSCAEERRTPRRCGRPRRSSTLWTRCWGSRIPGGRRRGMPSVSPVLRKGAILTFDPATGAPLATIMLQYNPDSLTRSLKPQAIGEQPDRTEVYRLKGPPIETIKADVEIDATDQLGASPPDPVAVSFGIAPQLSQLELLVYPSSRTLLGNESLSQMGTLEIL